MIPYYLYFWEDNRPITKKENLEGKDDRTKKDQGGAI